VDYNLDIVAIAQYLYNTQDGGNSTDITQYANDLFDTFDALIKATVAPTGRGPLTATERSIVAVIASRAPGGTAAAAAGNAVKAFFDYRGW